MNIVDFFKLDQNLQGFPREANVLYHDEQYDFKKCLHRDNKNLLQAWNLGGCTLYIVPCNDINNCKPCNCHA